MIEAVPCFISKNVIEIRLGTAHEKLLLIDKSRGVNYNILKIIETQEDGVWRMKMSKKK